jgi:hypothetical protein
MTLGVPQQQRETLYNNLLTAILLILKQEYKRLVFIQRKAIFFV